MKLVEKQVEEVKKEKPRTLAEVEKGLEAIQKQLEIECTKCDGTGKPKTKTGKPAKTGKNVKCKECFGTGIAGSRLNSIETSIVEIKREVRRIKTALETHINKQTVEVRVLPEGHNPKIHGGTSPEKWERGWEDYSGKFELDNDEEMSIVVDKALAHCEKYFKEGVYHRDKRLGVFLSSPKTSGKKLIEEFQTEE